MNSSDVTKVRVRFAPSPTGFLHVGGARTAIFNWLFARKYGGRFLLRIEDTDVARSGDEMVEAIFNGLKWLGLEWDEQPIFQSSRFHIYKQYAERLLLEQKAYKCFCSPERLQTARARAREAGQTFKYDRTCLQLSPEAIAEKEQAGTQFVIRFKVNPGQTEFEDKVFGRIQVDHSQLDDFVILRSGGIPTYHLAVVVDDKEMDMTHIIRGDDHLSNTPKHILLYQAFGWPLPIYAHVPLILGPDGQRLSKRHGATAVDEYKRAGYLPAAVLNFLSLLGWSSGDDRELFTRDQLIAEFDLTGISRKSAIFDEGKLEWMNGQYFQRLDDAEFIEAVVPDLIGAGLVTEEFASERRDYLIKIAALLKTRIRRTTEIVDLTRYFFRDPEEYEEKGLRKHWKDPGLVEQFGVLIDRLAQIKEFNGANVESVFRGLAEEWGVSAAKVIHPTRLALTGRTASPGLFEIMEILGRETVLRRLRKAVAYLKQNL